jgi:hypothetical protein
MCIINEGDEVYLVKGGKVLFKDGTTYPFSSCKWLGGKVILGISTSRPPKAKKRPIKYKPRIEGKVLLDDNLYLGEYTLEPMVIQTPKEPLIETQPTSYLVPISIIGVGLLYALKKVSGLDRKLKQGSCEIRHQEAITRIAKLEGKVLRKQISDGGKTIKSKLDQRKESKDDQKDKEEV